MTAFGHFIVFVILAIGISEAAGKLTRIVNGGDARPGEVPYQVSLQYKYISDYETSHFCGAAVLNKKYVITAAHCVIDEEFGDLRVVVGATNLTKPGAVHSVLWTHTHEKYRKPSHFANDIALVRVHPYIEFNEFTAPVTLPRPHQVIPDYSRVLATGWGSLKGLELTLPIILQKVKLTVVEQDYCSKIYSRVKPIPRPIFSGQFCTHNIVGERKGVCTGDSGGPLTTDGNVLVGIVSWSRKDPDCASPNFPDVQTRVAEYIDWIDENAV